MQQPTQKPANPIEEKIALFYFFADFLSSPLLPLLRRRIGRRVLAGKMFFAAFLLMGMGAVLMDEGSSGAQPDGQTAVSPYTTLRYPERPTRPGFLALVAFISCSLAAWQAGARDREFKQGVPWHSYHRGFSIFDSPRFRPGTAEKLIDPIVTILAGFATRYGLSTTLGGWLISAGVALFFVELRIYRINYLRTLDAVDAGIDTETLGNVVERFQKHPAATTHHTDTAQVIHAKLADDVEALIARRKRASANTAQNESAGTRNAQESKASLTFRQRFWRFIWGRRMWEWWQRRSAR